MARTSLKNSPPKKKILDRPDKWRRIIKLATNQVQVSRKKKSIPESIWKMHWPPSCLSDKDQWWTVIRRTKPNFCIVRGRWNFVQWYDTGSRTAPSYNRGNRTTTSHARFRSSTKKDELVVTLQIWDAEGQPLLAPVHSLHLKQAIRDSAFCADDVESIRQQLCWFSCLIVKPSILLRCDQLWTLLKNDTTRTTFIRIISSADASRSWPDMWKQVKSGGSRWQMTRLLDPGRRSHCCFHFHYSYR